MRFTDGVWQRKSGVTIKSAAEVGKLETSISPNSQFWHPLKVPSSERKALSSTGEGSFIRALCHTKAIVNPSGTLGPPTITLNVTSPMEGVVSFDVYHFRGKSAYKTVRPELFPDGPPPSPSSTVELDVEEGHVVGASLTSGNIGVTLDTRPSSFKATFFDSTSGKVLTTIGQESLQWILDENCRPDVFEVEYSVTGGQDPYHRQPDKSRKSFMSVSTSLGVGEKVHGLGERFGPFIKNGQQVEVTNGDGGTSSRVGYKNVPFFMTNKGYGVYYDHTESLSVEVQSDRMTKVQTTIAGERIRFNIIAGPSPKQILERYTAMTGRPPIPPDWSYGLWLSTSFLTQYDEKTVMSQIDRMEKEDIPLSVWHFDCFWSPPHEWCSFRWDPINFPDPKGFLERIHQRGIKVCVWINPYVAQESRIFEEGDAKGYFLQRLNGTTFQCDDWQAGMAYVDMTNPKAVAWWQDYLEQLVIDGVDSFKTDFGEKIPTHDVKYFDGSDPVAMRNQYSFLYNKAVQDVLTRVKGRDQACLFARSGTVGGQRLPVHWGGDCDSEFTGMAESLRGGLSLTLSGYAYWAHDIGGFKAEGVSGGHSMVTPGADVYKRWVPFGLLSSHSRLHGSGSYRVPWLFGQEACQVLSKYTKLKHRLEPYYLNLSQEAADKGTPLMRAMFLEFANDPTCWNLDTQYMFGDKLLVAPVFDTDTVEYFVPEAGGDWVNILDGSSKSTGWHTETHGYLTLPVLLRPGHALLIAHGNHRISQSWSSSGLTILVGSGTQGDIITICRGKGETLRATLSISGGKIRAKVDGVPGDTMLEVIVVGNGVGMDTLSNAGKSRQAGEARGIEWTL